MNNNPCIIFAVAGSRLLMYIRKVSDDLCSPPNAYQYEPRHRSKFVCDSRVGSATLPGAPNVLSGAPRCFQTYHNHSHCTPVSVIRDPSHSCTGRRRFQLLLSRSSEIPVTSVPVVGDSSYSEGLPEYPPKV